MSTPVLEIGPGTTTNRGNSLVAPFDPVDHRAEVRMLLITCPAQPTRLK